MADSSWPQTRPRHLDPTKHWITQPHPKSRIPSYFPADDRNESALERRYRQYCLELNTWNHLYWLHHNALFEERRKEFIANQKSKLELEPSRDELQLIGLTVPMNAEKLVQSLSTALPIDNNRPTKVDNKNEQSINQLSPDEMAVFYGQFLNEQRAKLLVYQKLVKFMTSEKFRDSMKMNERLIANIQQTIGDCRAKQIPIIFTMHGHRFPEFDHGVLGELLNHDLSNHGDADWQIISELNEHKLETDVVIDEKRVYDAFHNTPLDPILRQMKVDTVIICGVMTNLCCESTARAAFHRDYRVNLLSNACGTITKEAHEATLYNIAFGFGRVMTVDALRDDILPKEALKID